MSNMDIYNKVRSVPNEAKKAITAGRLKGMTDINPMWRIQALTEVFGAAGIGWYYEIRERWTEEGSGGERCAFVNIDLFVRNGNEWSKPIQGTGGSKFIAKEKSGLYTSDECYKMALTDAISVACKALGIGADVYWAAGRTKYSGYAPMPEPQKNSTAKVQTEPKAAQGKQEKAAEEAPAIINKSKYDLLNKKLNDLYVMSSDAYNKCSKWIEAEYTAELERLNVNQWKEIYDKVERKIGQLKAASAKSA